MWIEFCLLLSLALFAFYKWATHNYDHFKKRGIPSHTPTMLLGSNRDFILQRKTIMDVVIELYRMHDGKVYGMFDQRNPVLLIRDTELLKQITIKDFDHFMNHRNAFPDGSNLFSSSLFFLQDAKWKDMRSTLSPVFTGSKMRHMFALINDVAQNTVKYMQREPGMTAQGYEIDFKDYVTRYTNDAIATTAFGLEVNSLEHRDNEFYKMGKKVTNFTSLQNLKFFLYSNFHMLVKVFKLELFDKQSVDYFMHLVLDAMKYRIEKKITRPDMINMLMEARGMIGTEQPKSHNREWTDVEIVAQCFLFFFAGFETTAVLMCLAAHELMENPEIQQTLYEEVQTVQRDLDGKPLSYEALQGMKYMDMVMSETLRKWPPVQVIDRLCSKDFVCEADGQQLHIKKGEYVWLPVAGLHYDAKYWEEPTKFMPERFSEENKHKINPFVYFPFGLGPRNCIGSRFALLEAKALIYYVLSAFLIVPAAKSTIPMKLSPKTFQLRPEGGYWMKFVPRT